MNAYLREIAGSDALTARTSGRGTRPCTRPCSSRGKGTGGSPTRRRRTVAHVLREVAEELGNTPAVARKSYVDPRVVDSFVNGTTISPQQSVDSFPAPASVEREVLSLPS